MLFVSKREKKFYNYNIRNILTNLLQAEEHAKAMNTINFIEGEGSCYLKHLLFVRGELSEIISHSHALKKSAKTYENLLDKLEKFLDKVENAGKFTKRELILFVREMRKEFEKQNKSYTTFNCACLHAIPYLKILLIFLAGTGFGLSLYFLFKFLGL